MKYKHLGLAILFSMLFSVLVPMSAFATLEQAKLYKGAFGGEKPKCITCHVDKVPKKEAGKHEPNAYGKKLIAAKAKPDEATYKQVGPNPDAAAS